MERPTRLTDTEARDVISRIPVLRDLFQNEDGEPLVLGKVVEEESAAAYAHGFLYLSRFHSKQRLDAAKRKKDATTHLHHRKDKEAVKKEKDHAGVGVSTFGGLGLGLGLGGASNNKDDDNDKDGNATVVSNSSSSAHSNRSQQISHHAGDIRKPGILEQKRKFAISLATLASKKDKKAVIIKDGGIKTLISLCYYSDSVVALSCSVALALLTQERHYRAKMLEDGALGCLIHLTEHEVPEVRFNACAAVCNLCCEPGSEFRGVKEGVCAMVSSLVLINNTPDLVEVGHFLCAHICVHKN